MTSVLIPFSKMIVDITETDVGGLGITFNWDETDPDFQYWNSMTEQEKEEFVCTALLNNLKTQLNEETEQ
jgi:hypothetical protein